MVPIEWSVSDLLGCSCCIHDDATADDASDSFSATGIPPLSSCSNYAAIWVDM